MATLVHEVNDALRPACKADISECGILAAEGDCVRLLLVEDEPFIALDLEMLVQAEGHDVVGVADTFETAIDLASAEGPEAAFIDLNLRDGMTGLHVARALAQGRGMRVAFITGNAEQVPADFAGAVALVEKPFTQQGVAELLSILQAAIDGAPAAPARYARTAPGV